jgi:hypothetical protein
MSIRSAFTVIVFAAAASGAPITVLNPSFELAAIGTPGATSGVIANWSVTPGGISANLRATAAQLPGGVPDGLQVLQVETGSRFQTLTSVLTADTVYSLTVGVGRRSDRTMGSYLFTLEAGGTVIATGSAPPSVLPPVGGFLDVGILYTALAGNPLLGQALTIRFSHTAGPGDSHVLYDNVRLSATPLVPGEVPEPATALLLGVGLVGIGFARRRS